MQHLQHDLEQLPQNSRRQGLTDRLVEQTEEDRGSRDGGFVFQVIVSHFITWSIVDGKTRIEPKNIYSTLHRLDLFPNVEFKSGSATATYVTLSEVNILRRKFDMASEAIKKRISKEYAAEMAKIGHKVSLGEKNTVNSKFFQGKTMTVKFNIDKIVLREVSSSTLDSGLARMTLKVSTGMMDTLDGNHVKSWDKFNISVSGDASLSITNDVEPISSIREYDDIEKAEDMIFQTIVPSIVLELKGDKVAIDTYSNRSTQNAAYSMIDHDSLFKADKAYVPTGSSSEV